MKIPTLLNAMKLVSMFLMLSICLGMNAQNILWNDNGTAFIMKNDNPTNNNSGIEAREYLCPDDAVYGSLPFETITDDVIGSYPGSWLAQELVGIDAPLGGIKIYAISSNLNVGTVCEAEPREIELRFHNDSLGLPGEIIYETTQIIEGVESGDFISYNNAPVRTYTIMFDQPIYLTDGWFSIRSNEGDCDLEWPVHLNGQGHLAQNDYFWALLDFLGPFSLTYCLLPENPADDAPGYADNFTVTPAPLGELVADISWTNPSTDMSANPLGELSEIQLYVNNEMVYSVSDPVIGGNETFQYNATMHSIHGFHLYGINSSGNGAVVYASKFIGKDVPAAPTNAILTNIDENGFITWTPPTEGLHGGYFDGIINEYELVRHPDNAVLMIDGDLSEFTDETIPMPYTYNYRISAIGTMGISDSALTNNMNLGGGIERALVIGENIIMIEDPYCPSAANGFNDLQENGHKVGLMSYNYSDGYQFPDVDNRLIFNNFPMLPTTSFGGKLYVYGGYDDPSASLYDDYLPLVTQRFDLPTYLTIEIENANYTANTFSANVVIEAIEDVDNENVVLQAVLTESHIPASWYNQTELNYMVRDMYNGAGGTPIELEYNTPLTVPISFTLDGSWDASNCEVIVFVQDTLDREIFNANKYTDLITGIDDSEERNIQIYPNPSSDKITIKSAFYIEKVEMYNQVGQLVKLMSTNNNMLELNITELESGIYIMKLFSQGNVITRKLVVE